MFLIYYIKSKMERCRVETVLPTNKTGSGKVLRDSDITNVTHKQALNNEIEIPIFTPKSVCKGICLIIFLTVAVSSFAIIGGIADAITQVWYRNFSFDWNPIIRKTTYEMSTYFTVCS